MNITRRYYEILDILASAKPNQKVTIADIAEKIYNNDNKESTDAIRIYLHRMKNFGLVEAKEHKFPKYKKHVYKLTKFGRGLYNVLNKYADLDKVLGKRS